jgi:RNA ligase
MFNYSFPQIETIDDVLPHIKDREEFLVINKGWYTVINYAVNLEDTFPEVKCSGGSAKMRAERTLQYAIRRECRGLIFDANGKLISRPYHKFFNVGEKLETQTNKINLYEPHVVLEKLDGSMIRPIPYGDGFLLGTKAGVTEISEQAEKFISDKWIPTNERHKPYHTFIMKCIQKGTTPIFEWCSRKNRIVLDYPEDQLILTAIRYNYNGSYVNYKTMVSYATAWNIPVVKAVDGLAIQNIHLFVDQIREWEDSEGIVLRFENGHMVKIKANQYVLRHKSKEAINQEKNVIATIVNDDVDDLIPLLTEEDVDRLKKFQTAFWASLEDVGTDIYDLYKQFERGQSQKEFAILVNSHIPKTHQSFMFSLRNGVPIKNLLVEKIKTSINTQTKVNENRWMWGNLKWN